MSATFGVNFKDFSTLEFRPANPEVTAFVYVFFWMDGSKEMPFYVGQTSRFYGRLDDYNRPAFYATADFQVGEAVRYLYSKDFRVVVKYRPSEDPRGDERRLITQFQKSFIPLLNDLRAHDYETADEAQERAKVHLWVDDLLMRGAEFFTVVDERKVDAPLYGHDDEPLKMEEAGDSRIAGSKTDPFNRFNPDA